MRRSSSVAILAVCFALLGGTVLATAGSIAMGAWQPVWDRPDPTPNPNQPGPGGPIGPQPGGPDGQATYEEFLDEIRSGTVNFVYQDEFSFFAETSFGGFQVELPSADTDVYSDIIEAAAEGGVAPPRYVRDGVETPLDQRTYSQFLDDVRAGAAFYVSELGDDLAYETETGLHAITDVPPDANVLRDIRTAAEEAGVAPPSYNWSPKSQE